EQSESAVGIQVSTFVKPRVVRVLLDNWSVKVQGSEKGVKVLCATGSRSFLFLTGSITNNTKQSKSPTPAKSPTIAKSPTTDNNNHQYEMGIWTSYSRSVQPKV